MSGIVDGNTELRQQYNLMKHTPVLGAARVDGVSEFQVDGRGAEKVQFLKSLGADHVGGKLTKDAMNLLNRGS